jgi:hypothetical protein
MVTRRPDGRRLVRIVADLGLSLVPVLILEILTGVVLFLFAHGLTPRGSAIAGRIFNALASSNLLFIQDVTFQTDVHVWVGYLSTWAIALKAWASWPTLIGWWPRRFGSVRRTWEKTMSWLVLVLAPTCYLTGLALTLRPTPALYTSMRLVRDAHLWSSALLLVPLGWHVWRFLPIAIRVVTTQLRRTVKRTRRSVFAESRESANLIR